MISRLYSIFIIALACAVLSGCKSYTATGTIVSLESLGGDWKLITLDDGTELKVNNCWLAPIYTNRPVTIKWSAGNGSLQEITPITTIDNTNQIDLSEETNSLSSIFSGEIKEVVISYEPNSAHIRINNGESDIYCRKEEEIRIHQNKLVVGRD